jgi:hypothetical protein
LEEDRSVFQEYLEKFFGYSMLNKLSLNRSIHSNQLENSIIQFSERVSAILVYILIETLRPPKYAKLKDDRIRIIHEFLESMRFPSQLLASFLGALPHEFREKHAIGPDRAEIDENGNIVKDQNGKVKRIMLDSLNYEPDIGREIRPDAVSELMAAYSNMHSGIYNMLEDGYRYFVDSRVGYAKCNHTMYKTLIYKIGERYRCINCSLISKEFSS